MKDEEKHPTSENWRIFLIQAVVYGTVKLCKFCHQTLSIQAAETDEQYCKTDSPRHVQGSGVARTSPLLGHSGTLRLYELPREVQKLIGRSGGILPPPPPPPPRILQPPKSVLRPYTVAKCKSLNKTLVWWAAY